jgi:outer membrane biosynthesis protein TonB
MAETPEHDDQHATSAYEAPDSRGSVDKIVFVGVVLIAGVVFALAPARGSSGHGSHGPKDEKTPAAPVRALEPPPADPGEDEAEEGEAELEIVEEEAELPEGDPLLDPDEGEPGELELVPPSTPTEPEAPEPKSVEPKPAAPRPAAPQLRKPMPRPPSGDNPY